MNSKYDHSAYCSHCQRWISKTALVSNSSGNQMCPYCHSRVRVKRHVHDLSSRSRLTFEAEDSKTRHTQMLSKSAHQSTRELVCTLTHVQPVFTPAATEKLQADWPRTCFREMHVGFQVLGGFSILRGWSVNLKAAFLLAQSFVQRTETIGIRSLIDIECACSNFGNIIVFTFSLPWKCARMFGLGREYGLILKNGLISACFAVRVR